MLIVGEKINSSRPNINNAIASGDKEVIQREALAQVSAGADYIDVNAGAFGDQEFEYLKWLIRMVQEVVEVPLCIDSSNPEVIRSVLPLVNKTPMINSIDLTAYALDCLLPLISEFNTKVVALCQSKAGLAKKSQEKVDLAKRLAEKVTGAGISLDKLYIDPLVYPLSTDTASALESLNAIKKIMEVIPGVHTICGLTNVSYGLPMRKLINKTFLSQAILQGLDGIILDATDIRLMSMLEASLVVSGRDEFCMSYINAFREGKLLQ